MPDSNSGQPDTHVIQSQQNIEQRKHDMEILIARDREKVHYIDAVYKNSDTPPYSIEDLLIASNESELRRISVKPKASAEFTAITRAPNCARVEDIAACANGQISYGLIHYVGLLVGMLLIPLSMFTWLFTRQYLVENNKMLIVENNGKLELVGPGRHWLFSPFQRVLETLNMQADDIGKQLNALSIIWVKENEVGIAYEGRKPVILNPGLHVRNDPNFTFVKKSKLTEPLISCDGLHRIIVQQGEVGLAMEGSKPIFLDEGTHLINDGTFTFNGFLRLADLNDKEPHIHGRYTIVRISPNKYGYAVDGADQQILAKGIHIRDSAYFQFIETQDSDSEHLKFDSIQVIRVPGGYEGILKDQFGTIQMLKSGEPHIYTCPNVHYYPDKLVSIQLTNHSLGTIEVPLKGAIPLKMQCSYAYKIVDAGKLVRETADYERSVEELVKRTLTKAFSNHSLKELQLTPDKKDIDEVAECENLKEGVHQEKMEELEKASMWQSIMSHFTNELSEDLLELYGIEFQGINIDRYEFTNKEVAKNLEEQQVMLVEADNKVRMAKAEQKVQLIKTDTDAQKKVIEAKSEADAERERAKGEADAKRELAEGEKDANEMLEGSALTELRLRCDTGVRIAGAMNGWVIEPGTFNGVVSLASLPGALLNFSKQTSSRQPAVPTAASQSDTHEAQKRCDV